jgi:hypothetical protein
MKLLGAFLNDALKVCRIMLAATRLCASGLVYTSCIVILQGREGV